MSNYALSTELNEGQAPLDAVIGYHVWNNQSIIDCGQTLSEPMLTYCQLEA